MTMTIIVTVTTTITTTITLIRVYITTTITLIRIYLLFFLGIGSSLGVLRLVTVRVKVRVSGSRGPS